MSSDNADFEDTVIEYVDVMNLAMQIKNANKRAILIYKAMGYSNWEIALELGMSEIGVDKNIVWIKKFFKNIQKKVW